MRQSEVKCYNKEKDVYVKDMRRRLYVLDQLGHYLTLY